MLGGAFLQNYYVAFDASRDKPYIGITLDAGSDARIITIEPDNTVARDIGLIILSVIGIVLCIGCICACRTLRQKKHKENTKNLDKRKKKIERDESGSDEDEEEE